VRNPKNESAKKFYAGKIDFGALNQSNRRAQLSCAKLLIRTQMFRRTRMDRIYDRLASLAVRFEKPLGWFGAVWLGLTGAVYARFITLPLIPYVTDENAFWLSGGFNVLYWSVLYPQIEKRKKALLSEAQKNPCKAQS
jgi:hypothetical protein